MDNEIKTGIKNFILGGKADFTIYQEATDSNGAIQYKYNVRCNENKKLFFISTEKVIKSTVDTTTTPSSYQGYILGKDLSFHRGAKGDIATNEHAIKGLLYVLSHENSLSNKVHIFHHGRCSVCGRKLTDAISLQCGIGPTCRKRVQ